MVGLEYFFDPLLSHPFDKVGYLLAFILSFAGIPLGVFVGKTATTGQHHSLGYVVFRWYKANRPALASCFLAHQLINLRVILFKGINHISFFLKCSCSDCFGISKRRIIRLDLFIAKPKFLYKKYLSVDKF